MPELLDISAVLNALDVLSVLSVLSVLNVVGVPDVFGAHAARRIQLLVDAFRVFQDRLGIYPLAVFIQAKKTAVTAGMACNRRFMPKLRDFEQHHVAVTVHTYFMHCLNIARFLALEP